MLIITRSKWLSVLLMCITLFSGCKEKKASKTSNIDQSQKEMDTAIELLIGTYTQEESKGIYKSTFNENSGALTAPFLLVETDNPTFLCQSTDKKTVYAVNEVKEGSISSFSWNDGRTELTLVDQKLSGGSGPCHITLNGDQNLVAAAHYSSGSLSLFGTNDKGQLLGEPQVRNHKGSGPVLPAQASARGHYAAFSPKGNFVYIVDLGIDKVMSYPIAANGTLGQGQTALQLDPGDGPRHMLFHPTKNIVFIINEHSNSIVSATIDHTKGSFTRIDKKSTLPENYVEKSYCADIHISNDGKFLYGSNRGHNSIAVFSVLDDGTITPIDRVSVEGDWPRNFTLSPNGNYMLVANQKSNNITVFEIDKTTGIPSYTGQEVQLSSPVCLKF